MAIVDDDAAQAFCGLDSTDTLLPLVRPGAERLCKRYLGWDPERSAETDYYPLTERGSDAFYWLGNWGSHQQNAGGHNVIQLRRKWVLATPLTVSEYAGAYAGQDDDTDWDELTLGDDYALDLDDDNLSISGHLVRLGGDWPRQRSSVKVTYTGGFTASEFKGTVAGDTDYTDASDIRLAVCLAIAKAYNEAKTQQKQSGGRAPGAVVSETVPDYSYTLDRSSAAMTGMMVDLPPAVKLMLDPYRSYNVAT